MREEDLYQFTGTENYYRWPMNRIKYTDGVEYVMREGNAVWLVSDIMAAQHQHEVRALDFQYWVLEVNLETKTAELTCSDGNGEVVYRQSYEFTDFPLAQIEFYLTDNVLLLPSEN